MSSVASASSCSTDEPPFLAGGGQTGALIRSFDWSTTPLGAPETWPSALRTAVSLMLGAAQPVYLAWGPELTSLYNDGYLPIVGDKHPGIGKPFFELWSEIEPQFRPIVDATMRGQAQHFVDLPVALAGRPGVPIGYFTFSYTPLRDRLGAIQGFYVAATETTDRVLAERRRQALLDLDDTLRGLSKAADLSFASSKLLGEALGACRVGYGEIDAGAGTITVERAWTARDLPDVAGVHRFADYGSYLDQLRRGEAVAVADVAADPRTRERGDAFAVLGIRAILDVPVVEGGQTVAEVFLHSGEPRIWSPEEIAFVGSVAERTRAAVARREAEAAVQLRTEELETLLTSSPLGACFFDREHRWLRINAELAAVNGYPMEDHIGRRIEELLPVNAVSVVPVLEHVFATGETIRNAEVTGETAAEPGKTKHWLVSYYPVRDGSGQVAAVGAWVVDITDRKVAEERLAASEARMRAVVNAAPVGLVFADANGRITGGNAKVEEIVGHPILPSSNVDDYDRWISFHADGRQVAGRDYPLAKVIAGEAERAELEVLYRRGDGRRSWVRFIAAAVRDANGSLLGGVVASLDIDQEKRLTEQLAREVEQAVAERETALAQLLEVQKLETIGQMTGGVAHDFNNLLTPIVGSLDMLQRKGLGSERDQRLIQGALEAAERARTLVQRLLAFARRAPLQSGPVDTAKLIEGMRELIERSIGPTIALNIDVPPAPIFARADVNQLELALLNLAINAHDAMPAGGHLTIRTEERSVEAANDLLLPPGDYVCISASDTGVGMDAETLRRCVEPFFTSKGVGKGTGLGLSMVHGLCAQSDGKLILKSVPGEGTTAELWLPAAIADADDPKRGQRPAPMSARGGTVLVVDDDDLARESTAAMCAEFGYAVVEADCPARALEIFGERQVDVLLTDYLMANMTGAELGHAARELHPELPVLIITGFSRADEIESDFMRLEKPFRQMDLAERLDALIGGNGKIGQNRTGAAAP